MPENGSNYFYHVVTEKPMHIGQIITFDSNNQNGVSQRVKRVNELRKRNMSGANNFSEFDEIALDNFTYWCSVADRELALEKVRKELFSHYPSRMACLYTSTDLEDAQKWGKYFIKVGRKVFQIVLLENEGNCFTGDANNCWGGQVTDNEAYDNAIRYWTNGQNIRNLKPVPETIIDGRIHVLDILEQYI